MARRAVPLHGLSEAEVAGFFGGRVICNNALRFDQGCFGKTLLPVARLPESFGSHAQTVVLSTMAMILQGIGFLMQPALGLGILEWEPRVAPRQARDNPGLNDFNAVGVFLRSLRSLWLRIPGLVNGLN